MTRACPQRLSLDFDDLARELDLWAEAGRVARFWWRDDDAIAPTPALTQLLDLSDAHRIEVAVAVIPATASDALAGRASSRADTPRSCSTAMRTRTMRRPASRRSNAAASGRSTRCSASSARAGGGSQSCSARAPSRSSPRRGTASSGRCSTRLGEAGFRGASAYGPRARDGRGARPRRRQCACRSDELARAPLRRRRQGAERRSRRAQGAARRGATEADEPLGLLTHHLDHDAELWDFLDDFFRATTRASGRPLDRRSPRPSPPRRVDAIARSAPMSVVVRPAEEGDIDSVVDLLFDNMSQKVPKERWRRLLDYPWRPADADRGCVAVDGDRVVGFLGLVYADRPIGGRVERFCNICAWYLLKDYRGQGIGQKIQFGVGRRSAHDLHDHDGDRWRPAAPSATTAASRCSTTRAICSAAARARAATSIASTIPTGSSRCSAADDRKILDDHRPYNVRHLLVRAGDDGLLHRDAGEAEGRGHRLSRGHVCERPARCSARSRRRSPTRSSPSDTAVLAIDRRFLPAAPDWESETIRLPRWYRSARVAPGAHRPSLRGDRPARPEASVSSDAALRAAQSLPTIRNSAL